MLIKRVRRGWLIVVTILALLGCGEANHEDKLMTNVQISVAEWQALAKKRVVFGHQSVGQNILDGVQSLAAQAGIGIQVKESRGAVTDGAGIVHFSVGRNKFPDSKFKDFTETLENGLGNSADIALMKLCYVDFKADTDATLLADQYSAMLDRLSRQFPHTAFITVTTPLTTVQTGLIAWFKRLLGLEPDGYAENARRKEFNDLLRTRYGQQGYLFDLAKIESEGFNVPNYQERSIEALNPALTTDGGHLNTEGEKQVAARLVKLLAALPSRR